MSIQEAHVSNSLTEGLCKSAQAAQKAIHAPTQDGLPGSPCLDWEFLLINKQKPVPIMA
ncbi:hypothetical protein BDN71DRAFT_1509089 [Pleurotus eryngii]|uniref:Uncharacterized protein n=1 Tax=Pleurotus eryngii TaxID=5323 RepID=A0A9P5ZUD3_PLEER|nr:hypothetical protein BDN71DRAFT_1509089 [Pleurotus eryngii]